MGDLNRDGTVDFSDFFIFADHFGQSGPPDAPITLHDTVRVIQRDTLTLTRLDTFRLVLHDTTRELIHDTIRIVLRDTIWFTFRDTVRQTLRDTIYLSSDQRPPAQSFSQLTLQIEPSVYWLGISTTTASSTIFLGTGFAVSPVDIATNIHVAVGLNIYANSLAQLGLTPLIVAIRSRTPAYGSGTHYLARNAYYSHPDYDGTISSADVTTLIIDPSFS